MLETLKEAGKNIGREISRAWETLSDGWRELLTRSNNALTHFTRNASDTSNEQQLSTFPNWSLLAGEVEETDMEIIVRLEVPGMEKDNFQVKVDGNMLFVTGEKRFQRETDESTYHVTERAYGSFQRALSLPRNVKVEDASAQYKNGVLTIRLPKSSTTSSNSISIS